MELSENIRNYLKTRHYSNYEIKDNKFIINGNVNENFHHLKKLTEGDLNNFIIKGNLKLDITFMPNNCINNSIIEGDLYLNNLKEISENCFTNTVINKNIYLYSLEYLPKNFYLDVKGEIVFTRLKSKLLKKLLKFPGISRQLAFNLLKNH